MIPIIPALLLAFAAAPSPKNADPQVGGKRLSAWRAELAQPAARGRAEAAEAIGRLGAEAAPLAADLGRALVDSADGVRHAAMMALVRIGKGAVPEFVRAKDPANREIGARAIRVVGQSATWALPALRRLKTDPDDAVREAAEEAIGKIERK